jgi:2-methylaconitate cis-trans-isomerase PrpF
VASKIANIKATGEDKVMIEHPLGSIDCIVETSRTIEETDSNYIKSCGVYRTSRKIMDGNIYIPKDIENE